MANSQAPRTRLSKGGIALSLTSAMLAVATPYVGGWEGKRNDPYIDAVGVKTVCYGETRVAMRRYSDAECSAMLERGLAEFGSKVAELAPGIEQSPYEWAAHTSLSYNIGLAAYSRSSVRALFNAGDRVGACRFMRNYRYGGGKVLAGLVYRREGEGKRIGEYELCLVGAIPAQMGEG